jgi:hypothetical protein
MAGLENEILLMLGELREGQKRQERAIGEINEKLEVEEQRAHDNRSRIHERLDKQVREQGEIEGKIITIGLTLAQQRDLIDGVKVTIDNDIKPTVQEVKDIKRLGKTASIIFVGLGFTAGGVFFTMWDTVRPWIGKFLIR